MTDHNRLREHVIDREGYVWRVVRDGGMATRADYIGIESIGIETLRLTRGPLIDLEAALRAAPPSAPDPEPRRCLVVAGRCEKVTGHEGDHYTTYRPEVWGWSLAAPDRLRLAAERVIASFEWEDGGPLPTITDNALAFGNAVNRLRDAIASNASVPEATD